MEEREIRRVRRAQFVAAWAELAEAFVCGMLLMLIVVMLVGCTTAAPLWHAYRLEFE